jgi:hypothetical protein
MKDFLTQETIDFLAGSAAGALSIVVGQPFDTIKVTISSPSDSLSHIFPFLSFHQIFLGEIANKYEILRSC